MATSMTKLAFRFDFSFMKKMTFSFHVVGSVLFVLGFCAPLWTWLDGTYGGLWLVCSAGKCHSHEDLDHSFKFVQALMCLAFLLNVASFVFYILWFFTPDDFGMTRGAKLAFAFSMLAGGLTAAGVFSYYPPWSSYRSYFNIAYFCCDQSSFINMLNPLLCLFAIMFLDLNRDSPNPDVITPWEFSKPRTRENSQTVTTPSTASSSRARKPDTTFTEFTA